MKYLAGIVFGCLITGNLLVRFVIRRSRKQEREENWEADSTSSEQKEEWIRDFQAGEEPQKQDGDIHILADIGYCSSTEVIE